ncbi:hypothetical protein C7R88_03465 [Plesiomonas shigelloides]|uniref:Uncharacterized protein n=1 Tax=Plesiomonas shigelloides TaxID=703 RepID=A0A2P1VMP8_PLESH|nr:hypothetical protein [Plesiomonas shigelloides]AVQ86450.1 hypothetical protein C7R88_03465 [Plesiomonas shigelloides]MBO1109855.1 hypothetical protein [Plesiomonas shigelloides]
MKLDLFKYFDEKNFYLVSGVLVVCWMIFDPSWEPFAAFFSAAAVIRGISAAKQKSEKEEFLQAFNHFNNEISNSLAYLVDTHLADQDRENQKARMEKMWHEFGTGNKDVFADYIIHSLMTHNSQRCQFQVFNIVNTKGSIARQLVETMDKFLKTAAKHKVLDFVHQTKLYDLHQWITHPQYKMLRKQACWTIYV